MIEQTFSPPRKVSENYKKLNEDDKSLQRKFLRNLVGSEGYKRLSEDDKRFERKLVRKCAGGFGIRKAEAREDITGGRLPQIDLLPLIPHAGQQLNMALFGPGYFMCNYVKIRERHFHSSKLPDIYFCPATTAESISAAACTFLSFTREKILEQSWLQVGLVATTSEGVFVNPPENRSGKIKDYDERTLESSLKTKKKVRGIYLLDNDFGFAPYDSFNVEKQDSGTFVNGGLARVLEHTRGKRAENLSLIASTELNTKGVWVFDFKEVGSKVGLLGMRTSFYTDPSRIHVIANGFSVFYCFLDYPEPGYAFGRMKRYHAPKAPLR